MQKPEQVSAAWAVVIFATDQTAWLRPESSDCPGMEPQIRKRTWVRCRRGDLNPHALAGTSPSS